MKRHKLTKFHKAAIVIVIAVAIAFVVSYATIEYIRDNDSLLNGSAQRGGDVKIAFEIGEDLARRALERAGVEGELLGTYVYNSTHLVTLVKNIDLYAVVWNYAVVLYNESSVVTYKLKFEKYVEGELLGTHFYNSTHLVTLVKNIDLYAVVWNNESAVIHKLKFEKHREDNRSLFSEKYGDYTIVMSLRSVEYREVSGVLPFVLHQIDGWVDVTWYTPLGYFKTAAGGRFIIIDGLAVYFTDKSYYELTDPTMRLCSFQSRAEGSGTPQAGVHVESKAIRRTYAILATRLDTIAIIAYNAWRGYAIQVYYDSKNLAIGRDC